ncbi:MAG: putative ATPase [Candidatus Eremiobacteraeota bacterium]|nr:putative ATPase [Candidatus Eremiobacteraeota bacterium]
MFTDIEGSTVRWDRDPEAMRDAVRHHDALMRAAIERAGGIVFKTIGDAFCAVFWGADDAVPAALAATRDLAAADFSAVGGVRVRIALHVGTADERDSDYFGPTLNRVARLLSIGHGEQILLSEAAAEAALASLPPGAELRDMGVHRLKDLTAPEHVFQLTAVGLTADFPPLRSLNVANNNLPQQVTRLVGRDRDVAEIQAIVDGERIVTLLGTGGVGKTRCALQVGAEMLDRFQDGVWFADLAPLGDGTLVAGEIGSIFNVQESASRPMLDTLVRHLASKRLLLILDNCEHLIEASAKVAAALARACPGVNVLATSREPLNVRGEIVHRLPTLSVPHAAKHLTAHGALEHGAIVLFDMRARAVNPRFSVTDDNAGVVAEICRRLDGIPLAIELAAARVKSMSVRDLAARLDERFRLLTGGDRSALPRQQTMRALIDWSYDGLSQDERAVFRALSVFAGGFRTHTAVAVCSSEILDEYAVMDCVASLVEKSMVVMEASDDDSRYRLLESTRAYAREKATEHGELHAVALRHARAYAELAEQHERDYDTAPSPAWCAAVDFDLENVRAALSWSFGADGDVLAGQRLAATLGRIMLSVAAAEARRWVKTALERVGPATPSLRVARLKLADAALASVLNQFKPAVTAAQEALVRFDELADRHGIADAKRFAGRSMVRMGRVAEGEALLRAALETYAALGTRRIGGTLRDLAVARSLEADLAGARDLFARALDVFRESEDEENVAVTAAALAEAEFACGDAETALSLAEESLQAMRGFGRDRMAAALLGNIAAYLISLECYDLAQGHARAALELALEVDAQASVTFALQHLAAAAALQPRPEGQAVDDAFARIARITGCVDARLAELEVVREFTEEREYVATLEVLREQFADERIMELMNDGRSWTLERAVQAASAL